MKQHSRIALFGECMIELRGQMFGTMQQNFGGDTLNTAVYLARLGAEGGVRVSYATQLGNDAYSKAMLEAWALEGIDHPAGALRRRQDAWAVHDPGG